MNLSQLSEAQKKRIETAVENLTFGILLGIHLEAAEPGIAWMSLEIRDQLKQNNGVVHGGAIAALIDSAAAFAVIPLLDEGETATTVDLTISYLRPLVFGVAKASARVLRRGSRIMVVSAEVFDESGNLAATALTSYLRLNRRSEIPVDS
jgi:acyl-CoA thioesterase